MEVCEGTRSVAAREAAAPVVETNFFELFCCTCVIVVHRK